MSYHQPGAPLFSFRGEKRFRVFQPPQRRHPFSPIFFSCFSPFFRTRFIIISISSLHLLSPSFLFVRWSFPFGENNSILLIDQNIRRYRYCVICSEFSLENLIQLGENKIYIIYFGYFFRWNRGTPCMCMDRY